MQDFLAQLHSEIDKAKRNLYPMPQGHGILCLLPPRELINARRQLHQHYPASMVVEQKSEVPDSDVVTLIVRGVKIRLVPSYVPAGVFMHTISAE